MMPTMMLMAKVVMMMPTKRATKRMEKAEARRGNESLTERLALNPWPKLSVDAGKSYLPSSWRSTRSAPRRI